VRKREIKEGFIQSGIEVVCAFIDQQSADFQLIDHFSYLDHDRFESAIRGKAGIRGMQSALDGLCGRIKLEIDNNHCGHYF